MNIAIFASHGGTDMQAIVDGCKQGKINADVKILICNNPDAYVVERAKKEEIPYEIVNAKMTQNEAKYPAEKARGSSAKYDQL